MSDATGRGQAPALLGPDDPPAFTVVNAQGKAPVLLVCDHARHAVPRALGRLGLEERHLLQHIGWDIGAEAVTRLLAARLDAPAVLSGYSRLVIDCNRRPEDPSSIPEVSDGIPIPGNAGLSPLRRASRRAACFAPYHAAIAESLAGFARRGVDPVILSIHSFTPVMAGFARPWHVGVLWDEDPRFAVPLLRALEAADPERVVGENEPYSARHPVGYTMRAHATARGLADAMVEIRQDLIETRAGAEIWAEILASVVVPILTAHPFEPKPA